MLIRDPETDFERYVNTADPTPGPGWTPPARPSGNESGSHFVVLVSDTSNCARTGTGSRTSLGSCMAYRRVASMLHAPPQGVAE